jgi:hypothetical protein
VSQENVEIARRCCEAFDRGEYEAALEVMDPEIEYDMTHFPDGQVYRGRDGVREAFRIWLGTWNDYRVSAWLLAAGVRGGGYSAGDVSGERRTGSSLPGRVERSRPRDDPCAQ